MERKIFSKSCFWIQLWGCVLTGNDMSSIPREISPSLRLSLEAGPSSMIWRRIEHRCTVHSEMPDAAGDALLREALWLNDRRCTFRLSTPWLSVAIIRLPLTFNSLWKLSGAAPRYTGDKNNCMDISSDCVSWPSCARIPSTTNRNFFFSKLNMTWEQSRRTVCHVEADDWDACVSLLRFAHLQSATSHRCTSLCWRSPSPYPQTVGSCLWKRTRPDGRAPLWWQRRTAVPLPLGSWRPRKSEAWRWK